MTLFQDILLRRQLCSFFYFLHLLTNTDVKKMSSVLQTPLVLHCWHCLWIIPSYYDKRRNIYATHLSVCLGQAVILGFLLILPLGLFKHIPLEETYMNNTTMMCLEVMSPCPILMVNNSPVLHVQRLQPLFRNEMCFVSQIHVTQNNLLKPHFPFSKFYKHHTFLY